MRDTMIAFKDASTLRQFHDLHFGLKEVFEFVRRVWPKPIMVVTRIADPVAGKESGVHLGGPPHRAFDIRMGGDGKRRGEVSVEEGRDVVNAVNVVFHYNHPTEPYKVGLMHREGFQRHGHFQWRNESARIG